MTPPTLQTAGGSFGDAEPLLPVQLLALRERLLRPIAPAVAARHVALAAAAASSAAAAPRLPRRLRVTGADVTPGSVVLRATRTGARVSAVAAAVVLGTAGLAAAQILPAPATRAITSVIDALDLPVPWSEPAEPASVPPPSGSAKAVVPAVAPEEHDPAPSTTEAPTTTSTEAPTTTTTVPPTTTTTVPDDGVVDGTEEPPTTTTTTVPDDGTVDGAEQPPDTTTTTTTTTVPGTPGDDSGSGGDPA